MDDLLADFLAETNEGLNDLENSFLSIESAEDKQPLFNEAFRILHTIKGTCGFLGLTRLEKLSHVSETLLSMIRDGERDLNEDTSSVLFQAIDSLKAISISLESSGNEGEGDDSNLINEIKKHINAEEESLDKKYDIEENNSDLDVIAEKNDSTSEVSDEKVVEETESFDPVKPNTNEEEVTKKEVKEEKKENQPSSNAPVKVNQTLKVNLETLDDLMTLVSELVLTRNQLGQIIKDIPENEMTGLFSQINQITTDLQDAVTKTRMQTIDQAWLKLPRLVRDTAKMLGKNVNLLQEGGSTELDRQILELIKDPLIHMVRNSLDHGLEGPEERLKNNKCDTGTIRLSSQNEGSYVLIKISDDGRGINVDKIREKLISKNIISHERAMILSDEELFHYLFHPGFSTAEKVTNVSGRGVGMDVVMSNIEKLGGSIQISSVSGKGSVFTIRIPSTLSIISSLMVQIGEERFALPQGNVIELVQVGGISGRKVKLINGRPILKIREILIPIINLSQVLERKEDNNNDKKFQGHVVIMKMESLTFGVFVDRVCDIYEIVVKPLSTVLRSLKIFSGSTILGDGSVILILDPHYLSKELGEFEKKEIAESQNIIKKSEEIGSILLFFMGENKKKFVVQLSLISRIDEIDISKIEFDMNNQAIINYQDELLPVMCIGSKEVNEFDSDDSKLRPMLIFHHKKQPFGIIIDQILNILEKNIDVKVDVDQNGAVGMSVINNEVCYLMNIHYYFDRFKSLGIKTTIDEEKKPRILIVDDSQFFLNTIIPILQISGFDVVPYNEAEKAIEHLKEDKDFSVIITDIQMPEIDGFEFSKRIRGKYNIPIVALSAYQKKDDSSDELKSSFDEFVSKSDQQSLLHIIKSFSEKSSGAWK